MKHDPDILPSHYLLAEQYGTRAFDRSMLKRDAALTVLYYEYGPVVTEAMTGWTRPTIMSAVRREDAKHNRKTGPPGERPAGLIIKPKLSRADLETAARVAQVKPIVRNIIEKKAGKKK